MLELDHNVNNAVNYLIDKYKLNKKDNPQIVLSLTECIKQSNPRSTEKVMNLITNNASKELCIAYVGYDRYKDLVSAFKRTKNGQSLSNLEAAQLDATQGFTVYNNDKYLIQDPKELALRYELSDEETQILTKGFKLPTDIDLDGIKYTLMTQWAINNSEKLNHDLLIELSTLSSFNASEYLRKFKLNNETMTAQFETLKFILHKDSQGLLRKLCNERSIPLQVMKTYRNDLPWDLLKDYYRKGWLTENKVNEFKKELGLA